MKTNIKFATSVAGELGEFNVRIDEEHVREFEAMVESENFDSYSDLLADVDYYEGEMLE
jgi:hypothetical protein